MRPGEWIGRLKTEWLLSGWEKVHQNGEPWGYVTSDGERLFPPHGFISNLGSTPFFMWWFLPRDQFKNCYILHDFLYSTQPYSRAKCDYILDEAIYTFTGGFCAVRRALIYWTLRGLGWYAWARNKSAKHRALIKSLKKGDREQNK